MRLSNAQAVARPAYLDRNGIARQQQYGAFGVAPHANTQRWSYTVPVGKKAFLELFTCVAARETVATAASWVYAYIQYTPSGGAAASIAWALYVGNVVGNMDRNQNTAQKAMFAGDVLTGFTSDASTAGTNTLNLTAEIVEFDA